MGAVHGGEVVDAALGELEALIRHQRRRAVRAGCPTPVSMTHRHVLMVLEAEGPVPMNRLAETLLCSMPNASGIVDRMEERGLVERVHDEHDRRVVLARATTAGREALGELETMRRQHLRRVLTAMPEADQRLCLRAFRRLRETAERVEPAG